MSILRKGNVNEEVAEAQRALIAIDPKYKKILSAHSSKPDDGVFGGDTEAAVKQFQKDNQLTQSGKIDEATREALTNGVAIARKLPPLEVVEQETKREVSQALARARAEAAQVPKWDNFMGPKLDAGVAIAREAQSYVGRGETRGPNQGDFIDLCRSAAGNKHDGSAWCADFVSYVMNKAYPGLVKPDSMAAGLTNQFKRAHAYHKNDGSYTPKPGDLVSFEIQGEKGMKIAHVGVYQGLDENGKMKIVEGNVPHQKFDEYKNTDNLVWTKDNPDLVRERTWTLDETKQHLRIAGFGSVQEMAAAKGLSTEIGVNVAQAGQAARSQRPSRTV